MITSGETSTSPRHITPTRLLRLRGALMTGEVIDELAETFRVLFAEPGPAQRDRFRWRDVHGGPADRQPARSERRGSRFPSTRYAPRPHAEAKDHKGRDGSPGNWVHVTPAGLNVR